MSTPPIAHFGTTIIETAPPTGIDQQAVPRDGVLGDQLAFLEVLGFQPALENMYPGVGRQFIWRRGELTDVDYVELDNFTSYRALARPPSAGPRVGDTVFRLTHADPLASIRLLDDRQLIHGVVDDHKAAFLAGERDFLLLRSPAGQHYEFGATQPTTADNHRIYVWTEEARLDAVTANFHEHFGLAPAATIDFHGIGRARLLTRAQPGVTLGLLHGAPQGLAPRWTDDIFREAGYSHFRLGALDKQVTDAAVRQAFPAGGDVSFVYFEDCYLELVQA